MEIIDVTVLSSKGQIVIPFAARQCLRLNPGARFVLYTDGTNIVLRPIGKRDYAAFRKAIAKARASRGEKGKEPHQ